ncbi:MAG: hypothetical protein AB9836_00870 [Aminipila sp.]
MNRKYRNLGVFALVMFIMSVCLSGCNLANPELQDIKKGDKLIGVFATFEEDLKDYEIQEGDTLYYQEKKLVRADGSVRKLTDKEIKAFDNGFTVEGKKQKDGTYKFENIKGYCVVLTKDIDERDGESYMIAHSSEDVYDVKTSIRINDFNGNNKSKETSYDVEATIGVNAKANARVRINTIYQRNDGSVYTNIPGSDILSIDPVLGSRSELGNSGMKISESYEDNLTGTGISAQSKKETKNFKINIEQMDFLQSTEVRQMDKNHQLIEVSGINFSKKDQVLNLEKNTEYVIVEEHFIDAKGNTYSKRTAYDCDKIGTITQDGDENFQSHTFKKLNADGKVQLVNLKFVGR